MSYQAKWDERFDYNALHEKIRKLYNKIPYACQHLLRIEAEYSYALGHFMFVDGHPAVGADLKVLVDNFEEVVLMGVNNVLNYEAHWNKHISPQSNLTQAYKELYALLASLPEFTEAAKKLEAESKPVTPQVKNAALDESLDPQVKDALDETFLDNRTFTTI